MCSTSSSDRDVHAIIARDDGTADGERFATIAVTGKSGCARPMTPRFFRAALLLLLFAARVQGADVIAAVRLADDERVASTLVGDVKALAAIYSDEMYYAHSSGKLDTKASQLAGIADGTYKYTKFDYQDRTFNAVAPGIVLMKGKAIVGMTRRSGEKILLDLNYLGIWRLEQGKWRFLAWQASRNTPATVTP
jgi:hypothetical protein